MMSLLTAIFQSYMTVIIPIVVCALWAFFIGVYFILRQPSQSKMALSQAGVHDITAIAGDDMISTQLDLARAYIETNQKELAVDILHVIARRGSVAQQNEANRLLKLM